MTSATQTHQFSNWAKERLAEMDATLTSIEARLGALHAETKKQAEKAVSAIRAQRDEFQEAVRKEQHEWAAWAKAKTALDANWTSFETIVQKYMSEARQNTEQQQATFKARAERSAKPGRRRSRSARKGRRLCREQEARPRCCTRPFEGGSRNRKI